MLFVVDLIMNILPPGSILLPVPQYVFVPMQQVHIVPVLQNIPNPNNYVLITQQATPLVSVNVPYSNMNVHNCSSPEINNSYLTASIDNTSITDKNSINHSNTIHNIPNDSIDNDGDDIPIFYLTDSESDVVVLDSSSDMSTNSLSAFDIDGYHVNDDCNDEYVDDDDDEESISGAYWF